MALCVQPIQLLLCRSSSAPDLSALSSENRLWHCLLAFQVIGVGCCCSPCHRRSPLVTLCRVCGFRLTPLSPSVLQSSCSQKCTKKSALHLAEDLFIASEAISRAGRETLPYLDDDIPLLSVEEEPGMCLQGDHTALFILQFFLSLPLVCASVSLLLSWQWCCHRRL